MNRQDAKNTKKESDQDLDRLANLVIGAAIEVHRHLGPGYLESIDEKALATELGIRGIQFERQALTSVTYKGITVGRGKPDFPVEAG